MKNLYAFYTTIPCSIVSKEFYGWMWPLRALIQLTYLEIYILILFRLFRSYSLLIPLALFHAVNHFNLE